MLSEVEFEYCDYNNPAHLNRLVELINIYMTDPMGGATPLNKLQQLRLVDGLNNNPNAYVLFAIQGNDAVGLVTFFENFSTFKAKPYLNLHDIIVDPKFREKGYGKLLLEKVIEIAKEKNCCKVTLEVREDNTTAQTMYIDSGFTECKPRMHFWTKSLD
jgi:ribosomal protein S18 acetylase RimI-like enzyme